MFAFTTLAVLALAALGARADIVISTPPSLVVCQKANFQVTGWNGQGSLYAVVVKASDPCGDALKEIDVNGSFDWTVDLPAGERVMVAIEDKDGNEAWTGALEIQPGDSSCVTSAAASSTSSTAPRTTARVNNGVANAASPTDTDATGAASRPMVAGAAFAGIAAAVAALVF
ncbi:hypothetical protein FRC17_000451 [Serendipita sp. 399]|nr:hypothetical protein FRC17_000451 [Serendipita sp. 399]